ncbi:glucose PTS transporter transcription antiterminator GlcT [Halanaerobacter jeridensis]|uniref:Transcriptional antiterminator n=1 Tax=Halanaerobacter jeridensis TaxID=706427 RepID=A0A939BQI6_9FIRM|nr:transcription antiterminator [Halanaerobacter jeridensis]MBM7558218.1 transcriptional antiterminator [Halanaerobacter jeridensis]
MSDLKDISYKVKKIFNNNVVLAQKRNNNKELILLGKGIGFGTTKGDIIQRDEVTIDKEFVPIKGEKKEAYQKLLNEVDEQVIGVTEEIIAMVSSQLEEELNEHIRIGLADHIAFALKRIEDGMDLTNPFLTETKTLYQEEYELAQEAIDMIEQRFDVSMPESEVGFITLHIHGARENRGVSKTLKYTSLIQKMVAKVEEKLGEKLSYETLNYARLVNHLRFALERVEKDEVNPNPMLDDIKDKFPRAYQISIKLAQMIEEELKVDVPKDEVGYLAMHVQRLRRDLNKNE